MATVFNPRSGRQSTHTAPTKYKPLPNTPQRNATRDRATTPGMLFQSQPIPTAARVLGHIELNYARLYLDSEKQAAYDDAKTNQDWETAWHSKIARYPNQGQAIYAAILRYCPEAADACPGGNYVLMPRKYLDLAATKAAMFGDLVAFKPMVRVGADLANSALTKAALNGCDNIVEFLLNPENNVGLNPNHRYSYSGSSKLKGELTHVIAINSAAKSAHVSTIRLLVRYGAYLSATDSRGNNALNTLLYQPRLEAATALINSYRSKKNPLPCEVIDYHNVSFANMNTLALAYGAMKVAHVDLMYELREKLAEQRRVQPSTISSKDIRADSECQNTITTLLAPWIALCEIIQKASLLSPGVGNINPRTHQASLAPIAAYGRSPESEIRLGYVQDLAVTSPGFVKALSMQAQSSLDREVNNFCVSVAELELTMPTMRR